MGQRGFSNVVRIIFGNMPQVHTNTFQKTQRKLERPKANQDFSKANHVRIEDSLQDNKNTAFKKDN